MPGSQGRARRIHDPNRPNSKKALGQNRPKHPHSKIPHREGWDGWKNGQEENDRDALTYICAFLPQRNALHCGWKCHHPVMRRSIIMSSCFGHYTATYTRGLHRYIPATSYIIPLTPPASAKSVKKLIQRTQ